MKKKIIIGSICLLVLFAIIILINGGSSKNKDLKEDYLKIFENRKFVLNGKTKTMKDLLNDAGQIEKYSFVDYGNDNHLEMFVEIMDGENKNYVFNLEGKKMYAYLLDEDVVLNSEDGYSSINGNNVGWVRYTFNKNKVKKETIINMKYNEKICVYKNEEFNCDDFIDKQIEFLDTIKPAVEIIEYTN